MTVPPTIPSWAQPKAEDGPPPPDSRLDRQFAAFVGPRWPAYRRKFTPFFADPRFQPTWNWAAAVLSPFWFLYRKLYLPFLFFAIAPGFVFGLLWGDQSPVQQAPAATPGAPPTLALTPDASLILLGILLSSGILAGGTANFLLFRRATAAIRVVAPRAPSEEAGLTLLQRVGGVSWRSVVVGFASLLLVQALAAAAAGAGAR